ncbi:YceD family protein [Kiritimatiella glycovorans]|uniref:YceD family protein n=1 Tax=Kiritimatiella glycovorans TaxID=1307763 RepID=UPI00191BF8FF|nr:DUF177 domain-containing protein [Kiritimatiella glycovorans]
MTRIPERGVRVEGEEPPGVLELEEDPIAREESPVRWELELQLVSRELVVRGSVSAGVRLRCARCGDFFSTTLQDSSFLRGYPVDEGIAEVDITPDLREALLLNLEAYSLCRPECRGICPQCGKNLNEGPCGCRPEEGPGPWDELDNLNL